MKLIKTVDLHLLKGVHGMMRLDVDSTNNSQSIMYVHHKNNNG